jgi:hypothetical protein
MQHAACIQHDVKVLCVQAACMQTQIR